MNLEGTNTREDFLAKVKERVGKTAPGKWITGRGWIETFWKPPTFPTRQDLDKIAPDNPVFLTRADGHAAIANSAALKIAGIDRKTSNPFGGEILKDKAGDASGMLLDNAQDLVEKKIPKTTEAEREQALLRGVEREIKLGWCEIQNAGSELADQAIMRRAFEANKIKLRIYNAAWGPGTAADALLKNGPTLNAFDHHFTQRTIKVIFDGALGSRGAALLAPYSDKPDTSGYLTQKPEELSPMFEEALRRGIQVETHAIGDRANRLILDLYEKAFAAVPPNERKIGEPRWRVEHAQILSEQEIPRFAKLGVIASMQPSHAISDLFFAPARLGMERLGRRLRVEQSAQNRRDYLRRIRRTGRTRRTDDRILCRRRAQKREGILRRRLASRGSCVARTSAENVYALAAYAAFEEKEKGSIEVGKLADFTVLSPTS